MATTGTNYTAKWELIDGTLTISPISGDSGEMRGPLVFSIDVPYIKKVVDMTDEEWLSVTSIVFAGSVAIKRLTILGDRYEPYVDGLFKQSTLIGGDQTLKNLALIDVSGLNTEGCWSFRYVFERLSSLTEIIGIDTLNTIAVTNYSNMFEGTSISELDLTTFGNMNTANISAMISSTNYLSTLILPNDFSRKTSYDGSTVGFFGIASSVIHATNVQTGVTVQSDNDFFSLESGQGGTWLRDVNKTATLSFRVRSVQRDGNDVVISYSYASSEATVYVYIKESSASSYPQTPADVFTLHGSGNGSANLTLTTDNAYDVQIVCTDGTTNLYVFASVDSNVLLIEFDSNGNMKATGDVEDGAGNKLSDFADYVLKTTPYYELDTTAASGTTDGDLYAAINALGWASDVIV